MTLFWVTAMVMGLLGSLHCAVMCGPIAIALAAQKPAFQVTMLAYHAGRITSYLVIGMLIGLVGKGLYLAGLQQFLSVLAGVMLLALYALPQALGHTFFLHRWITFFSQNLKKWIRPYFHNRSVAGRYATGVLNGLLPCGLVYVAAAGAVATGSPASGAAYMFFFGMGTLPMMLGVQLFSGKLMPMIQQKWRRVTTVVIVSMAILFIMRGMNLGIRYISPELTPPKGKAPITVCSTSE